MKKIIFSLCAFVLVFSFASIKTTHAETFLCGDPANSTVDITGAPIITYTQCGNGDPMRIAMPWGLLAGQTRQVKAGETVTDETGLSYTCSVDANEKGCFDLTYLDYYRNEMISLVAQLKANGTLNQFPTLSGWASK